MMTEKEVNDTKVILAYFFGKSADNWNVNELVMAKLVTMVEGNKQCAKAMDWVPRPGFIIDRNHIKRQLRGIAIRILSDDHAYFICKRIIAHKWARIIELAGMGFDNE